MIADETASPQIFSRERLIFSCTAKVLARDDESWQHAAALYAARFDKMFRLLRGLRDFQMVRLTPNEGQLVVGFGEAYSIGGPALDVLTHQRRA